MNLIEAWNKIEVGQKIQWKGDRLIWRLTKKHDTLLLKMLYDLGIGDIAFLSDKWEILT